MIVRIESSRDRRGATIEPSREAAPKTANRPPISPPERPCLRPTTITTRKSASKMRFVHEKSSAHARKKRWLQSQRTPSTSSARSAAGLSSRSSWNGVRIASSDTSEQTYETTSVDERQHAREPEERSAERRRDQRHRRVAGLLGGGRGRELPPGDDRAQRAELGDVEEHVQRPLDERDDRDRHDGDVVDGDRDDERRHGDDADEVGRDHDPLAVEPVGDDARDHAEERPRHDAREADDAGLRRRVRDREHEQGIGDRGRLGADRRERLPGLEQDEVAVAAERGRASRGERRLDLDHFAFASASWRVSRYAAESEQHDEHRDDLEAVVDQRDERGACCDGQGLRHAEEHIRGRGDPALQLARAAALVGGCERDDRPHDPEAGDRDRGQDDAEPRDEPAERPEPEHGKPDPGESQLADPSHETRRRQAAEDRRRLPGTSP